MKTFTILCILCVVANPAIADRFRGGATLHYDASYVHHTDDTNQTTGLGLAGALLRGLASPHAVDTRFIKHMVGGPQRFA